MSFRVYPFPEGEKPSEDYRVYINGKESFCYTTYMFVPDDTEVELFEPRRISPEMYIMGRPCSPVSFTAFDADEKVKVEIELLRKSSGKTVIRPLDCNISFTEECGRITFYLDKPCNISVEPFGLSRPLHIFANPVQTDIPDKNADNVYYFEAGVHEIDPLVLNDGDIVYLEGGAVVYEKPQLDVDPTEQVLGNSMWFAQPTIKCCGKKNIKIMGRGILCGSKTLAAHQRHRLICPKHSTNVLIEGIILRESTSWSVQASFCDGLTVDNIKIMGFYPNNDGVDICECKNTVVKNCFAHNADDSFIIKAWGPVDNVVFENCVAWTDVSASFGAVGELGDSITNVVFKNCTVIHSTLPLWAPESCGVIGIWSLYEGTVDGMTFENIIIEDACAGKELIKINISEKENMVIKNVTFKNILAYDTRDERVYVSAMKPGNVKNIHFENVVINGKRLTESMVTVNNGENITVE